MKFIQLTAREDLAPVYINADLISVIEIMHKGTKVCLDSRYVAVKESPEDIFRLINGHEKS